MPGGNEVLYHAWHAPSQAVSILLNLKLVDSLRGWIGSSQPARREVGGLLLGRLERGQDRASITVESCEPMRISHRLGPEFALTDGERDLLMKRFSESREGGLRPVGFVRSDLRNCADLDHADQQLLQGASVQTESGDAVYLLVRPGPEFNAACFCAHGDGSHQRVDSMPGPAFENWAVSQWVVAMVACLIVALAGAGYYWQQSRVVTGPTGFGLNVQHSGKELRLTWDPRALHGQTVLLVNDGTFQRRIRLSQEEIEHGSARYVPASNQVSFRLETAGVADSIWIVPSAAPAPPEVAAQSKTQPHKPSPFQPAKSDPVALNLTSNFASNPPKLVPATLVTSGVTPAVTTSAAPKPVAKPMEKVEKVAPAPVALPKPAAKSAARPQAQPIAAEPVRTMPAIAKQEAPKYLTPAQPRAVSVVPQPAPTVAASATAPEPAFTVNYTASVDPTERHGIEKVPVLRMFKHTHSIEPARPIGELKPRVPGYLVRQLSGDGVVTVEATVDKHGRVSGVEPLSSRADERLVRLVTDTVNRAAFYPAQSNGHEVNSKLVLTFHFDRSSSGATSASRVAVR